MNCKRTFLANIYNERNKRLRTMGIEVEDRGLVNIRAVLLEVKSLFPTEKFKRPLPPIVLKHQIYALLPDRTEVDKQLNEMRKRGEIRLFKFGSSQEEVAVVFLDDYLEHVARCCEKNSSVATFLNRVVKHCPDVSFNKDDLIGQYKMKEQNIRELIQHGVLATKDVGCYWLSIPQVGEFVKAFRYGRRAMLQCIRRTKYKEILQKELEQRKLPKNAVLGNKYFIYDLIGMDLVKSINTGCESMLRLQLQNS